MSVSAVFERLRDDCRGATAIVVALLIPVLMGAVGLAVDANLLFLESHRLQIAADAAAYTAGLMLSNASAQANSPASFKTIATNAITGVTGDALVGSPVTSAVSVASDFSTVTVTLTSAQASIFSAVLGLSSFSMQATAQAGVSKSTPCVLALATRAAQAINVNNSGSITATSCAVGSNSSSSSSIALASGTVTGTSISVVGSTTNSQGTFSPTPLTGQSASIDPYSSIVVPSYGSCVQSPGTLNGGTFSPGTVCGNLTVSGTITMTAGTYYVINGNLTFSNVTINSAPGVTMVLAGSSPGTFTWSNNSNGTLTAPTSGTFNGVLIYQVCPSNTGFASSNFTGGGTMTITGAIYLPCGLLNMSNNTQIKTLTSGTAVASVVAGEIAVAGSAGLAITGGTSSAGAQVTLLQ